MPFPYTFPFLFDPMGAANAEGKLGLRIAFTSAALDTAPVWVDVTTHLRSIYIRRGRQHELDRFEAGQAVIVLNNERGDYWPDNTGSPYTGTVKLRKRIHIFKTYDADDYDLFTGYIDAWVPGWRGGAGLGALMTLHCSDLIRLLSRHPLNDAGGYAQELSGTRIGNVLDDFGWAAGDRAIDTGQQNVIASGAIANVKAMAHIFAVCNSELSNFYISPGGWAVYEDRSHRTASPHDTVQATFGNDRAAGELPFEAVEFSLDDKLLWNEVRGTRTGGSEQTSDNSTSQTAYGMSGRNDSGLLLTTDVLVAVRNDYLIARFSDVDGLRIRSITIKPQFLPAALWPKALGYDISTRIAVNLDQASITGEYFIEGIEHTWNVEQQEWLTKWTLSEASRYLYTPDARNETLRPESDASVQWTPQGEATRWECVDEAVADDATTYVYGEIDGGGWVIDRYGLPNPELLGTVNSVTAYARGLQIGAVGDFQVTLELGLRIGGTNYFGAANNLTTGWANYSKEWTVSPATSDPFTEAELNALEVVIKAPDPGNAWDERAWVTQVYIVVNITPAW